MSTPRYIAVVSLRTGAVLYCKTSELRAAQLLVPGTVFGVGSSESSATAHAMRRMAEHSEAIQT